MSDKKLVSLNNLDKLSKSLNVRYEEMIQEKSDRAMAEIEITKGMLDGKSIKYVTQAEYDNLSDAEKNSDTIAYFITDAVDLSHEHDNKEFLDNLAARNIAIGNKSQSFDGINDLVYTIEDIGASPTVHSHDDLYYTEDEIDEKLKVVNALKLNGYSIWVGTTEELETITKNPNTLYFEISDENSDDVVQVEISDGVLQLTTNKYQKTNMRTGTEIVFPTVDKFTEIHLYFDAETDMDLNFPDCRWRIDPNIEAGKSYEIVATYNTIQWLVNVIVYS